MQVFMKRKILSCLLILLVGALTLHAGIVTHLHEDWRLQSGCKIQATGDSISIAGFPVDGWLKTSVPSTVVAAQVAAGAIPDPYYGELADFERVFDLSEQAAQGLLQSLADQAKIDSRSR